VVRRQAKAGLSDVERVFFGKHKIFPGVPLRVSDGCRAFRLVSNNGRRRGQARQTEFA